MCDDVEEKHAVCVSESNDRTRLVMNDASSNAADLATDGTTSSTTPAAVDLVENSKQLHIRDDQQNFSQRPDSKARAILSPSVRNTIRQKRDASQPSESHQKLGCSDANGPQRDCDSDSDSDGDFPRRKRRRTSNSRRMILSSSPMTAESPRPIEEGSVAQADDEVCTPAAVVSKKARSR